MKNFKFPVLLIVLLITTCFSLSAQVIDRAWEKDENKASLDPNAKLGHVSNRLYVPYPYIREADVMWSKREWRTIDLKEKINLPLYYPTTPVRDRKSLYHVLLDAVLSGDDNVVPIITRPALAPDSKLVTPFRTEALREFYADSIEVAKTLVRADTSAQDGDGDGIDSDIGKSITTRTDIYGKTVTEPEVIIDASKPDIQMVNISAIKPEHVTQYKVVEDWFFDKHRGEMVSRIISICPVAEVHKLNSAGVDTIVDMKELFWLYFPEIRPVLARHEVFNRHNNAERRSFDDLFQKRMFGSYITKEENVYDRSINEYVTGLNALLESERIKNDVFIIEHDLWEW